MIDLQQEAVDRIFLFGPDLSLDEERHEHRRERDGKEAREEHGERLGKGKGLEQPAGLLFKGKDRKKAHGDHEERKEERGTDLLGRVDDHINSRTGLSRLLPVFQLLCAFSTMMIEASTIAPMAMAMPESS